MGILIEDKYRKWEEKCDERFRRLKANEEELNRIFAGLYGLGKEISPEVDESRISVSRADLSREVRSLISYAVGCIFGRFSPDREGLCYAGGRWEPGCYGRVIPVRDNIVTVTPTGTDWDITQRFSDFVAKVYGEDVLEKNMAFIAEALGGREEPEKTVGEYFQSGFYADHLRTYRKRPIYWMVSSGPRKAFCALIYYHRYEPGVFEMMDRGPLSARIRLLEGKLGILNGSRPGGEGTRKETERIEKDIDELRSFSVRLEELTERRMILDRNDGIKHNYGLLSEVLEVIR